MVAMPPGHGKTVLGTFTFGPWYLATHPDHKLLVLSYSDPRSRKFGREIRNTCIKAAKDGYPGLKLAKDSKGKSNFVTEQGNEVSAMGFAGEVAGERADCILIDDPVKSMVEARSEARMEEIHDIYRSVVKARLKPGGIIIAYLTRYGMRDFAGRVLDAEASRWKQLTFPAEQPPDSGRYLWSAYHGKDLYEEAKQDPETWWSVWQQSPKSLRMHVFREEWLQFWDPPGIGVAA